jgi:ferredoxin-NADP reductase
MPPLADLFDGARDIQADIDSRPANDTDYLAAIATTIDAYHPRRLELTVAEVITETENTRTFRLSPAGGAKLPPFLAGQYVNVFADATSRPYAISSSPANLDHYDLTVRSVPNGRISNYLIGTLSVGDTLNTTGPMGSFYYNPLAHGDNLIFIAGGSGVAPAMSMIRDITDHQLPISFHLIYGSRAADDIIFAAALDKIAGDYPNIRVDHVILGPDPTWPGSTGLLTAQTINALAGPLDNRMVYVCGPQGLYPYALDQLTQLGQPRRRIRFEANGAPSRPQDQPHWPADTDPSQNVTVTVRSGKFRTPRGRPLLDALEDHGIRPETACRSGECSLCRIRILKGDVYTADEAKLRMSDHTSGYTHSCVAYPLTDIEIDI